MGWPGVLVGGSSDSSVIITVTLGESIEVNILHIKVTGVNLLT